MKEINRIWKVYQSIRMTPEIMRNGTVILLYIQGSKTPCMQWQTSISDTQPKFGAWNWKALKVFERLPKKSYQNIRITPPTLWNGTFILLYSNVPNFAAQSDKPQYLSNNQNLVPGITCTILRNGTFILLYSEVPKNPTRSDTPIMTDL